ncbi:unnamed protein product [Closterium sp. NIES-54]
MTLKATIAMWARRVCDPRDTKAAWAVARLLLIAEAVLCSAIIAKVPYTKIDWDAYMAQVTGFQHGERDYTKLEGDTGPLVYPAGFLLSFSALKWITGGIVANAQVGAPLGARAAVSLQASALHLPAAPLAPDSLIPDTCPICHLFSISGAPLGARAAVSLQASTLHLPAPPLQRLSRHGFPSRLAPQTPVIQMDPCSASIQLDSSTTASPWPSCTPPCSDCSRLDGRIPAVLLFRWMDPSSASLQVSREKAEARV